ncbi:hypothetical protein H5410_001931 [Solanum commersonii]|uniref:Uncharacterized protein n=1 Tax=Solanum commersonii TaxID=4109 RepID=A0A9J6B0F7_SOLCO|nr:hypothetical protein H5410_001931 [Solanum commersonii]
MDEEETPSKRITRGIQSNQEFLDDFPSFSLGLAQDFQEISGSIAKSKINQQEGMSKSGNTPLKMKEVMHVAKSKGKTKKLDKHKEDKSIDVLTSKKKRKVKEIASTSNKQDKSVDVLISKKKHKGKDIASTSNKENAQSDSVEQLHFGRIEVSRGFTISATVSFCFSNSSKPVIQSDPEIPDATIVELSQYSLF